mmetsp:Transcript_5236/g.7561  ORF Transcript_5236/g.7561 Transcript_5236/m.7561 type:complete len:435 (+) Transcript_5236:120-1424(+)|eukprot:CAMPEP_0194226828 /NCGR_PEP_ID=MMETSP0156-20130528/42541_1 /TAXON_ID=33649 /ORGANISM="Thalassionema nitzschioides, Strain L26-B" /LENGTH=434 /DNA_ID=CAMNT_0038959289 /DNA_START=40 /DNA_END=1344 /DNA_ORIENTATION=-
MKITTLFLLSTNLAAAAANAPSPAIPTRNSLGQEVYGHDVSWPINNSTSIGWGHVNALYHEFMDECREAAGDSAVWKCNNGEIDRLKMNRLQPTTMRNFTRNGFEKIRAPEEMFAIIKEFWEKNNQRNETEWHTVNTYHNMWSAPPTIVNIQLEKHGGGQAIKNKVWEAARQTLENWTGMHLSPCSIWGIRVYTNNSILTTHVDRNPLVTSAIINVDQDVDEPWPLEVWGHDGLPYNITMEPGDMVLYESHSVLHGRPFPMKGRYFANIFVHFEPIGTFRRENHEDFDQDMEYHEDSLESLSQGLPPYILPRNTWADRWRENNPDGWKLLVSNILQAAGAGDLRAVDNLFIQNPDSIHEVDANGWGALHLSSRRGDLTIVKYLQERGIDMRQKTNAGEDALSLARKYHGEDHELVKYLEREDYIVVGDWFQAQK